MNARKQPVIKSTPAKTRLRTRSHKGGQTTRSNLIEMAEAMFGRRGLDGVSLRQIGLAVGSANENVVSYHFGSKEGLIEAIFQHRLPSLEARRAELLAIATQSGRANALEILTDAIWRPWYEQKNSQGNHSFASFLSGLGRSDWHPVRLGMDKQFPVTRDISDRIDALLPGMTKQRQLERWILASGVITTTLQRIDLIYSVDAKKTERVFADAERVAIAVLTAPTK